MKCLCLIAGLALLPAPAGAQVVINPAALTQLAGTGPAAPAPAPAPMAHHLVHRTAYRAPFRAAKPALPPEPEKPRPVPAVAAPPPPAPPQKPASPIAIAFAPGSATLPAAAAAALAPLCHAKNFVSIDATAPGGPNDPSAAMRLSLNRAFTIRAALTACGIPASRIIPRALGTVPGHAEDISEVSLAP